MRLRNDRTSAILDNNFHALRNVPVYAFFELRIIIFLGWGCIPPSYRGGTRPRALCNEHQARPRPARSGYVNGGAEWNPTGRDAHWRCRHQALAAGSRGREAATDQPSDEWSADEWRLPTRPRCASRPASHRHGSDILAKQPNCKGEHVAVRLLLCQNPAGE